NEEVLEFVRHRIAKQIPPEIICEELMTRCLANDCRMGGLGCDNMTVVIVCFLNGEPYEKLAERCKSSLVLTNENINNKLANDFDDENEFDDLK
ncbi:unnamed protein product, partial [Brachionus calyciflorus]